MRGEQLVSQVATTEARLHGPLDEYLTSTKARNAIKADEVSIDYIGQVGGPIYAVAMVGDFAYVGEGGNLTILDISTPNAPLVVGRSANFPNLLRDVVVVDGYAYAADLWSGGFQLIDVSDPTKPSVVGSFNTPGSALSVIVANEFAYVADGGYGGLRVIDISDPADPTEVGFLDTPGSAYGVDVEGNYVYVADGYSGLRVIDVSDPSNPSEVGSCNMPDHAYDVEVVGKYAYLADSFMGGLRVIDVSNPAVPLEVGYYNNMHGLSSNAVVVDGDYAFVANGGDYSTLQVIDVSDPTNPIGIGSYSTPGYTQSVAIAEDYIGMTAGRGGFRVIDVSVPSNPSEIGSYDILDIAKDVAVSGGYAYVADGDYSGLGVIDVSDPASPKQVGYFETPDDPQGVTVMGGYAYMAGEAGLQVIDVNDPANPIGVGSLDLPEDAEDVAVAEGYAYVADGFNGLRVIDVHEPTNPLEIGYYNTQGQAHSVAIISEYAYVADDYLEVIDISNPANPKKVGFYDTLGDAKNVALRGGYAYVADIVGLQVIDVNEPASPIGVGSIDTPGDAWDVWVIGGYAYISEGYNGLQVVDVSEPANPTHVGSYETAGWANSVTVVGGYVYVADREGGLIILKCTGLKDETNIVITSDAPDPSQPGQPISVAFEVTSTYGVPSGVVTVTAAGEETICMDTLVEGMGECEITLENPGTFSIKAGYSGNDDFLPNSTIEEHTVIGDSVIAILSDEPDPSQAGQTIIVTFEVTTDFGTPSGTVTVTVADEVENCTGALTDGVGDCEITLANPGVYDLSATYSGDDYYLPSNATVQHTVVKGDTVTKIISDEPDPSQIGQSVTVSFEVTANFGIPSGIVTVMVAGESESCTDTLTGGVGECEITLSDLGVYSLTATYSGDDDFLSSSVIVEHSVVPAKLFLPLVFRK